MRLCHVALGVAIGHLSEEIHEVGGENRGPHVRRFLENAGIVIPAPWCAAWVQYCTDAAAKIIGVRNPLDDVVREAYVQDYVTLAEEKDWLAEPTAVGRGDLVVYRWGSRWNHIGIVMDPPTHTLDQSDVYHGPVRAIEGNTSPNVGEDEKEKVREGEGIYRKVRQVGDTDRITFIRWDGGLSG